MKICRKMALAACLQAAALVWTAPTWSHHSTAMYDRANPRTVSGTVTAFKWINPHVMLEITADAKSDPQARTWIMEGSSPGVMTRSGWTKRSVQAGDKVTVEINPLRDGSAGGEIKALTLPSGEVLKWGL